MALEHVGIAWNSTYPTKAYKRPIAANPQVHSFSFSSSSSSSQRVPSPLPSGHRRQLLNLVGKPTLV